MCMTKDLTQGSPMGLIVRFALPTLLGMLFQQLYNMVDTMIVGKLLGPFLPVAHHGHWSALPHDPDRHADSGGHL